MCVPGFILLVRTLLLALWQLQWMSVNSIHGLHVCLCICVFSKTTQSLFGFFHTSFYCARWYYGCFKLTSRFTNHSFSHCADTVPLLHRESVRIYVFRSFRSLVELLLYWWHTNCIFTGTVDKDKAHRESGWNKILRTKSRKHNSNNAVTQDDSQFGS